MMKGSPWRPGARYIEASKPGPRGSQDGSQSAQERLEDESSLPGHLEFRDRILGPQGTLILERCLPRGPVGSIFYQ